MIHGWIFNTNWKSRVNFIIRIVFLVFLVNGMVLAGGMSIYGADSVTKIGTVPAPVFSLVSGTYNSEQSVAISCSLDGAEIHYTTNGIDPTKTDRMIHSGGIVLINRTMTLKARAWKPDYTRSAVCSANYTITIVATPRFSLAERLYTAAQSVSIHCATLGAAIYYTTDGSDPTKLSKPYNGLPIAITATTTLKARAWKTGLTRSNIKTALYTITGTVAKPSFSIGTGTYATAQTVTIHCSTPGATIHYTTNGVEPAETDPVIASGSSLLVEATTTLKAKAWKTDWATSTAKTALYTITSIATPKFSPDGGSFANSTEVTVTCGTPGAAIHYTTTGNDPGETDPTIDSGAKIVLNSSCIFKARAWKAGLTPSTVKTASYTNTQKVCFADPNLEAVIRNTIGKPAGDINREDLLAIDCLFAQYKDISELSGLEECKNLSYAEFLGNRITNLAPLSRLANLSYLGLYNNQITDITPLAGLNKLGMLTLGSPLADGCKNQITDITPLQNLTNLMYLNLSENKISDISALSGLTNLTYLQLNNNQVADIAPLAGLTKLNMLWLNNNHITEVSALAGKTNLTNLLLNNNQITDIAPLAGLTQLTELTLDDNSISDLSALSGLTKLEVLTFGNNRITGITPLAGMRRLYKLWFGGNQVSDISVISGFTNLNSLHLPMNRVTSIAPISGLINLSDLALDDNPISDLSPLWGLMNLTNLSLSRIQSTDFTPLGGLWRLTELRLNDNQISNLSPLSQLGNLGSLQLAGNQITDLTPISGLTRLYWLDLSNNRIDNLTPLSGLTQLIYLRLDHNQITDITPLARLWQLHELHLDNNQLTDISAIFDLTRLFYIQINSNPGLITTPGSPARIMIDYWIASGYDVIY